MSTPSPAPLQGMSDISAPDVFLWNHIEHTARDVFALYGFTEVRTPVVERLDVFARSIGEQTDVVRKEMYAFTDRGGREVALRPEGTAGVIRHLAGIGGDAADARVYYVGPMFRAERPQAGRRRQFHQIGVEALGAPSPFSDAECMALQMQFLQKIGLTECVLRVNTRGDDEDFSTVSAGLRDALNPHRAALCSDCARRMDENVLRVLDCKQASCRDVVQTVPPISAFMGEPATAYFADVLRLLKRLDTDFVHDPLLVRGLDYYQHTIWEITHPALGAQDSLSGGGRYRISMGGKAFEGVGFALGMERLVLALQNAGVSIADPHAAQRIWIVSAGAAVREDNFVLAQTLRRDGLACSLDVSGRSVKAQMRAANRAGARRVILRGEAEQERGIYLLKDMDSGAQSELTLPELLNACRGAATGS